MQFSAFRTFHCLLCGKWLSSIVTLNDHIDVSIWGNEFSYRDHDLMLPCQRNRRTYTKRCGDRTPSDVENVFWDKIRNRQR